MDLQTISVALGITAGVTQLVGYGFYVRLTKHANTGSWAIWAFGAGVDLASYSYMTQDLVKDILPAVCALACIGLCVFMFIKKRFSPPEASDWTYFGLDVGITLIWIFVIRNATVASLLYQVSTALSFRPMVRDQLNRRDDPEHPLPWLVWTIAYILMLVSVAMRLSTWQELAYPVAHAVAHFVMFWVAFQRAKNQRPSR